MPDHRSDGQNGEPARSHAVSAALDTAVAAAQHGNEDAFRHLYRAIQPRMLNYLRAMVGETDAEDIASEAWSRIARDLRSFRGDTDDFRAWTATIARHRALDHLRRRHPVIPLPPEEFPHRPAREDTERDAVEGISTAYALALIAELPPNQAQAILLRVVIGLDAPSAAKVLGKRPGAIRTAAHRGLRNLAKRLQATDNSTDRDHGEPSQCLGVTPSPFRP